MGLLRFKIMCYLIVIFFLAVMAWIVYHYIEGILKQISNPSFFSFK